MKKQYISPVITIYPALVEYAILAGSPSSLSESKSASGLDNAPDNGGKNDGSHEPGAKTGYVNYGMWEE